jgi:hypothetical protein
MQSYLGIDLTQHQELTHTEECTIYTGKERTVFFSRSFFAYEFFDRYTRLSGPVNFDATDKWIVRSTLRKGNHNLTTTIGNN